MAQQYIDGLALDILLNPVKRAKLAQEKELADLEDERERLEREIADATLVRDELVRLETRK